MKSRFIKAIALVMLITLALLSLAGCASFDKKYELVLGTVYTEGEASGIAAALLLDEDGRIVLCRIDEFNLGGDGTLTSKKDLGDDYGMSKAGAVEWDDQVAYLERTMIGKNREEALATESGSAELTAGCTIYAGGLISAVAAAFDSENRTEFTRAGEITIALTFAAKKVTDTSYTVAASAVAMHRGYKLTSLTSIDKIGK